MKTSSFLVSCRKNITSSTDFVSPQEFGLDHLKMKDSKVLVLVHGYASEYNKTLEAYQTISDRVKGYDHIVFFFWPSSWSRTIGFAMAERRTQRAALFLDCILQKLEMSNNDVTIQAHSLGCKVVLELAKIIKNSNNKGRFILTAPAVDNDYFKKNEIDPKLLFEVLTSKNDDVLRVTYRLMPYNWFSKAMGYAGPILDKENVAWYELNDVMGHSDYRNRDSFYKILDYA